MGSRGHVPLIRFAATLNIDTQDRQDEKRVRSKGSTPVGFLRGQPDAPRERGRPARILSPPPRLSTLPADAASVEAGGEPWPGSRLIRAGGVGPGCARTGAGGTPALPGGDCSHPSCSSRGGRTGLPGRRPAHAAEPSRLVTLRGFLFSAFVDNPQFQTSFKQVRPLPCRADHTRVKQSEIDHSFATLVSRRGSPQCLSGPSSFFVALRG